MWTIANRFVVDDTHKPISGGIADVYRAVDMGMGGALVAIKLCRGGKHAEKVLLEAFDRELRALQAISHENVVELVDFGSDSHTGQRFIVLEWLPNDLHQLISKRPFTDWESYFRQVGRPVLSGLVHALGKRWMHRDLKPQNILLTEASVPKVADFNTSKFSGYLNPGATMMDFVTRPYAPPETESADYPETRDVYSFCVLSLRCLQAHDFTGYEDVDGALVAAVLPDSIRAALARGLSREPADRQRNVGELLDDLVGRDDRLGWAPDAVAVTIHPGAMLRLKVLLGETDETRIRAFVNRDLGEAPFGRFLITGNSPTGVAFDSGVIEVYTIEHIYKLALDNNTNAGFVLTAALPVAPSLMDRRKAFALALPVRFVVSKVLAEDLPAVEAIDRLRLQLEELEHKNQEILKDRAADELFRVWNNILRAKDKVEQRREQPIRYVGFDVAEDRVQFSIADSIPDDIVGQARLVRLPEGGTIKGEILSAGQSRITLACERFVSPDELPIRGELVIDTSLSRLALQKQVDALGAVRAGRALRPELKSMLIDPAGLAQPGAVDG